MGSIHAALQTARQVIPLSEARLLLGTLLEKNLAWLEAHRDDELQDALAERFAHWVARREAGEPVAYLLGCREFYGRDFAVSPAVLIPRHETELLVELALAKLPASGNPALLDLGTGSGCIAITLALEMPHVAVTAVDASSEALAVASQNAKALGATVDFLLGSWFAPVAGRRFDVIVSNPPYIKADDPHLAQGDVRFEPPSALASGADGLDDIRVIITAAPAHLTPGGWLLFEHGYDQAEAMVAVLQQGGFSGIEQHRDLAGIVRVTLGQWPGL
ncbi:peptide chain release factor N(5)-glutamine methyltransferase [Denitratisoma sp. agr-D3]